MTERQIDDQKKDPSETDPRGLRAWVREKYLYLNSLLRGSGDGSILARGASWSVLINGFGMALGFATQLVLTRALGKEGYGVYAYALGWVNTIVMLTTLDFGMAAVRFVGGYSGANEWGKVRAFLREIRLVILPLTSLIGMAAGIYLVSHQDSFSETELSAYLLACILLPVVAYVVFLENVNKGLKRSSWLRVRPR